MKNKEYLNVSDLVAEFEVLREEIQNLKTQIIYSDNRINNLSDVINNQRDIINTILTTTTPVK